MIPRLVLPKGFQATGINSGVRRYRPDLGIIFSQKDCVAAGVFTKSTLKAAPVLYDMSLLPSDRIRAVVVNSGHANAATGAEGVEDNLYLAQRSAQALGIEQNQVLVASTGVIGVRMPLEVLCPALPGALRAFSETINNFALAIMTTDLVPKAVSREVHLSQGLVTITGASKGSGMIHPNMGTMLGFVVCDAEVSKAWLNEKVKKIADETFNMISVDGETSTNDSFMVLANGASNVKPANKKDEELLEEGLREVATHLAISIARDGEGASKLITVNVQGAPSLEIAREAARAITTSPLIKSAIHGEDPNWGRILARLGFAGVELRCLEKLVLDLQNVRVFNEGRPVAFDRAEARAQLRNEEVTINLDFKSGKFKATAWGCDLTKRYVEINTEYS